MNQIRHFGMAVVISALVGSGAWADDWSGKVVGVSDGDTLTVLKEGRGTKVRLIEIDAPESRQDFGVKSKQSLSDLCFGMEATVDDQGADKYGRRLGRVNCAGVDVNLEQVKRGLAWFYADYGHDLALKAAEEQARSARVGLWAGSNPTPPWDFRHGANRLARNDSASPGVGSGNVGTAPAVSTKSKASGYSCAGKTKCGEMTSCAEARFYLEQCGLSRLDRDHDGVPCESICR